jgi:hypothetical protein
MKIFTQKRFFALVAGVLLSGSVLAGVRTKRITLTAETGAKISVNGNVIAPADNEIAIEPYQTAVVKVEKVGFITAERSYLNDGNHEIPRTEFIKLEVDEAWEASIAIDQANHDVELKPSLKEEDAWKKISGIVTGYFDILETTDKSAGYLRTGWVLKNYKTATIRTRVIIKSASTDPLVYKAKLVSEIGKPGASSSQDEAFKPWDRVLRSYENLIPDLQSRLK